jgi:hypothetical protein
MATKIMNPFYNVEIIWGPNKLLCEVNIYSKWLQFNKIRRNETTTRNSCIRNCDHPYSWGGWFESRPGFHLHLLRLSVVFLRLSSQMSGWYLEHTKTNHHSPIMSPFCAIQTNTYARPQRRIKSTRECRTNFQVQHSQDEMFPHGRMHYHYYHGV